MITPMEQDYFEQLINTQFKHLNERIDVLQHTCNSSLAHAKETNGRVTELEKWQSKVCGKDEEELINKRERSWLVALIVGIVSTIATLLATREWH